MRKKYLKTSSALISALMMTFISGCSMTSDIKDIASSEYYDSSQQKIEKQKVGRPYQIKGKWYKPAYQTDYDETGIASWYGDYFHGRDTANGERFDMNKVSAAHKTLPLPSYVEVTNLDNGKKLYVRVNDRGPFADGRIIDLSKEAARQLGFKDAGLARVRVKQVSPPKNVVLISPDGQKQIGTGYKPNINMTTHNPIQTASHKLPLYNKDYFSNPNHMPQIAAATTKSTKNMGNIDTVAQIIKEHNASAAYGLASSPPAEKKTISQIAALPEKHYKIQVGVFQSQDNINRLRRQLAPYGTVEVSPYYREGQKLSSVAVGPYKNLEKAQETIDVLGQLGINKVGILQSK